jgi:2,5-diketo-D-gluconate reductase A
MWCAARKTVYYNQIIYTVWSGYRKEVNAIDESLRTMKLDYIDLLLMHEPFHDYHGIYRAMEEAYQNGKVRAIGVSNFNPDVFVNFAESCNIIPADCCSRFNFQTSLYDYPASL